MIYNPNSLCCFVFDPDDNETIYTGVPFLIQSTGGRQDWGQIFPEKEETVNEKWRGKRS